MHGYVYISMCARVLETRRDTHILLYTDQGKDTMGERESGDTHKNIQLVCLFLFYILATSKVISVRVPTCDSGDFIVLLHLETMQPAL